MIPESASSAPTKLYILIIILSVSGILLLSLFLVKASRQSKAGDDRNSTVIQEESHNSQSRALANKTKEQTSSIAKVDFLPNQKQKASSENSGNIRNQIKHFDAYLKMDENGHCPVNMVYIEGGEFERNYIVSDALECRRKVIITKGYCLDKYEVTQENYKDIMGGENPSSFKKCGLNCPVSRITLNEAQRFCGKVEKRLPTAAEWEYAVLQGDKQRAFDWINDSTVAFKRKSTNKPGNKPAQKIHQIHGQSCAKRLCPVGTSKLPDLDLYDMYGNVWEFTVDPETLIYTEDTYSCFWGEITTLEPQKDPGRKDAHGEVIMGGSWKSWKYSDDDTDEMDIRSSFRERLRYQDVGFRCAKDAQ